MKAKRERKVRSRSASKSDDGEKNIKKLRKLILDDDALQEKLGRLKTGEDIYAALRKIGDEKGLTFTKRDFKRLVADPERRTAELTVEEITSMAGGFHMYPPKTAQVHFGNTLIQTLRWFDIPLQR